MPQKSAMNFTLTLREHSYLFKVCECGNNSITTGVFVLVPVMNIVSAIDDS